jgi:hypothetical protein
MAIWTTEDASVCDNPNEFNWRLAAPFAELGLMRFGAALVAARVFMVQRFATFWTVHGVTPA